MATLFEAARACHDHGIKVMMGAPNLIRGGSHSGNVAAHVLAEADLLDIRNFGSKSIDEVKLKLVGMGLQLKDSPVGFDPTQSPGYHDNGDDEDEDDDDDDEEEEEEDVLRCC